MMKFLLKLIMVNFLGSTVSSIGGEVTDRLQGLADEAWWKVRRAGLGLSILLLAVLLWATGLLFMMLALFFYFGELTVYYLPALWTGLVSLAFGLIMILVSLSVFRSR